MARVKKTEEEKDNLLIRLLKIFGVFVTIIGLYIVAIGVMQYAFSLVIYDNQLANTHAAIVETTGSIFTILTLDFAVFLMFQVVNYVCYLDNRKKVLLASVFTEILILFAHILFIPDVWQFFLYLSLISIITGIINYLILVLKIKD